MSAGLCGRLALTPEENRARQRGQQLKIEHRAINGDLAEKLMPARKIIRENDICQSR